MRVLYVLSDRQSVRTVDVDADKRVADLLKLIQAQSRVDYAPRDGLKLYRAQKHGDSDAPWLQAGHTDHVALCSGDKDVQAAFFVEKALLEPNQRLGDVFDLSALMSDESIQLVVKVRDDVDLANESEASRKKTLLFVIVGVSPVILVNNVPMVAQMASHWKTALSACQANPPTCELGHLGYISIATLLVAALTVLVVWLMIKVLGAMYTQQTPMLDTMHAAFAICGVLTTVMALTESIALGYSESTSAIEVIQFVAALMFSQSAALWVVAGLMSEISTASSGVALIVMSIMPTIGRVSSPRTNPFST